MADIPHFNFPFTRGDDGHIGTVEQDTPEHVMACENVIVRCPTGFREDRPEFGIPWPEYRTTVNASEITSALRAFEPRSNVSGHELRDRLDPSTSHVTINVEV